MYGYGIGNGERTTFGWLAILNGWPFFWKIQLLEIRNFRLGKALIILMGCATATCVNTGFNVGLSDPTKP